MPIVFIRTPEYYDDLYNLSIKKLSVKYSIHPSTISRDRHNRGGIAKNKWRGTPSS